MNSKNIEIEAKFYIQNPDGFRDLLQSLGIQCNSERILERNWRFDTPDRKLSAKGEVLRIREDRRFRLTYKRPIIGTLQRREIELEVEDFENMNLLLEALGYEVFHLYEKYRETYRINEVEIALDEVPYGHFVEIEGPSIDSIREVAKRVEIAWKRSVTSTYVGLFEKLQENLNFSFSNATFDEFAQLGQVPIELLELQNAFQIDPLRE